MRSALLALSILGLALAGCEGENNVPTDAEGALDFRVVFGDAVASDSCGDGIGGAADSWNEDVALYRIWFPDPDGIVFRLWWRNEGDSAEDSSFFAEGTMRGTLETGNLEYAGGPFTEDRGDGVITYRIEGDVRARAADLWDNGQERFIIEDSTNQNAYRPGCVFTLNYEATLQTESGGE